VLRLPAPAQTAGAEAACCSVLPPGRTRSNAGLFHYKNGTSRARGNSTPARPCMARLSVFSRLIWPSTSPLWVSQTALVVLEQAAPGGRAGGCPVCDIPSAAIKSSGDRSAWMDCWRMITGCIWYGIRREARPDTSTHFKVDGRRCSHRCVRRTDRTRRRDRGLPLRCSAALVP
jgi:hypothetical protein